MNVTRTGDADLAGGLRTVSEFLGNDHRRLDALFHEAVGLVSGGSFAEARGVFADFASGLIRHIEMEEGILYPLSDRVAGDERERDDLVRRMQAV